MTTEEKQKELAKWRQQKRRDRAKADGVCVVCCKRIPENGRACCAECLKKSAERQRKFKATRKKKENCNTCVLAGTDACLYQKRPSSVNVCKMYVGEEDK